MEKALRHDLKITNLMIFHDLYWWCMRVCVYSGDPSGCACVCVCVYTAMVVCACEYALV